MNDDLRRSLNTLHDKQDTQTSKLITLEMQLSKQDVVLAQYTQQSDRMAEELKEMNSHLAAYNAELRVHIAGVLELKEQNRLMREANAATAALLEARLGKLEAPHKWLEMTGKIFKYIGAICTAAAAIIGLAAWLAGRF